MAKRGRKAAKTDEAANHGPVAILSALEFLEQAAKFEGPANQTHCMLRNNTATIFNGLIAIGALVDLPVNCNPHLLMLTGALRKCKTETLITYAAGAATLQIKSGRFVAHVPCLPDDLFGDVFPSPSIAPLNDSFKTSIEIVGRVAVESSPRLMCASVYVRTGSAVATDGVIMFEHWHGHSMPDMTLPKTSVSAMLKVAKKLVGFGCVFDELNRPSSVTFWYEDQSWLRTQLYVEPWPSIDRILETPANLWPIPAGLWDGLENISDFIGEAGQVWLRLKTVSSHRELELGATFEIEGALPELLVLNHEFLMMFQTVALQVDWVCTPDLVKFQGENFRGILAKVKVRASDE